MEDRRKIIRLTVTPEQSGKRIDLVLASALSDWSRTAIQRAVAEGGVRINGKVCTEKRFIAAEGDRIEFQPPEEKIPCEAKAEKIPLDILYEDDSVLVISKPAGMVVHPAAGNWTGTVVNAVLGRGLEQEDFEEDDPLRPGIVHRLDKDTSGCLVVAKNSRAMHRLSRSFAEREVSKTYLAIVSPCPPALSGEMNNCIGRSPGNRKKMAVVDSARGREAKTSFTSLKRGWIGHNSAALLQVRIMTGRTHQIRVHMAYAHTPVIGDALYGGNSRIPAPRQMLHAWKIVFPHPDTGEILSIEAPVPADFQQYADAIQTERGKS